MRGGVHGGVRGVRNPPMRSVSPVLTACFSIGLLLGAILSRVGVLKDRMVGDPGDAGAGPGASPDAAAPKRAPLLQGGSSPPAARPPAGLLATHSQRYATLEDAVCEHCSRLSAPRHATSLGMSRGPVWSACVYVHRACEWS